MWHESAIVRFLATSASEQLLHCFDDVFFFICLISFIQNVTKKYYIRVIFWHYDSRKKHTCQFTQHKCFHWQMFYKTNLNYTSCLDESKILSVLCPYIKWGRWRDTECYDFGQLCVFGFSMILQHSVFSLYFVLDALSCGKGLF